MWQFKGNLFPHVIDVSLPNRVNLLSSGESGTGKSALGRILCSACNRRRYDERLFTVLFWWL